MVVTLAHLVAGYARSILDDMNEVVFQQECERPEDRRTVHRVEDIVQFSQRQRVSLLRQGAIDEEACRGRFHTSRLQPASIILCLYHA